MMFENKPKQPVKTECDVCNNTENLWACLICGHLGCGRYAGQHAKEHFQVTRHAFAIDLNSQRIWDYGQDAFGNFFIFYFRVALIDGSR